MELERCEKRKARLEQAHQELAQMKPQANTLPTEQEILQSLEGFRCLLTSGTPQEKKTVLEEHIEEIQVPSTGEVLLKANPAGILSLPDFAINVVPKEGLEPSRSRPHWILRPLLADFVSSCFLRAVPITALFSCTYELATVNPCEWR